MLGVKGRAALKSGKGAPSPIDILLNPPEKPRGFLSFLTSPFILAHLFLVQQLFGDSIRSTLAADSTNAHESNGHDRALTEAEDQQVQPVLQTTRVDFTPQGDTVAAVQAKLASGVDPVKPDTQRVERECIRGVSGSPTGNAGERCCSPPSSDQ